MTPAQMFDGDLYVLASDAVQMAENAYKNGQTDEREACAEVCKNLPFEPDGESWGDGVEMCISAIRERSYS